MLGDVVAFIKRWWWWSASHQHTCRCVTHYHHCLCVIIIILLFVSLHWTSVNHGSQYRNEISKWHQSV